MATRGLLVKVSGSGANFTSARKGLKGLDVAPILSVPAQAAAPGFGVDAAPAATWLRLGAGDGGRTPWDDAHDLLRDSGPFGIAGSTGVMAAEPDLEQQWIFEPARETGAGIAEAADICAFVDQDDKGQKAKGPGNDWNAGDAFSELSKAQAHFGDELEQKLRRILVAHLDTGYDPGHVAIPPNLRRDLQKNFVKGEGADDDASDHTPPGQDLISNRGHGTATLVLLAGNRLDGTSPSWPGFKDFIGAAPYAAVIPIRIADWVVRFTTGTMVEGFAYAQKCGAHVLSMSMGGMTSFALVDAVNAAYEAGIVMVTAAGNNLADLPSPKSIVFPARYRRVLAACGVMADGRPYADLSFGTMQGNYGPPSKMDTALGAYTPNVPWAKIGCPKVVDMDGAGTSSATPQIAAAAALWLAEHWDVVRLYPQPWMRIEAVRRALFAKAAKTTARMPADEVRQTIGQGVLKADAALAEKPADAAALTKLAPVRPSFPFIDLIFGGGVSLADTQPRDRMLALELTQMAQRVPEVNSAMRDTDLPAEAVQAPARRRYLEAALESGNPSAPLRAALEAAIGVKPVPAARPALTEVSDEPPPPIRRKQKELQTPPRRLTVYALDPSIAKTVASVAVNQTTVSIPWEEDLQPGPVGEYVEVVDIDPASNRLYDPVDLNAPKLLASDGFPPSEGNPQFHQQMVYAIAMKTIGHFEEALGRKALWAPRRIQERTAGGQYRPKVYETSRLRIYPHALRTQNAYYSPDKAALLFGYFPADSKQDDATAPGSIVFSCLSADIVAHEMSHALLDGLHRRFQEASNPDVPAFHEAFADIVALFQHFTIEELVRFEIAKARGRLSGDAMLGGLAKQFGEAVNRDGPLRNYVSGEIKALRYADTRDIHARGSILVSAVYTAFLTIFEVRTVDLVRIATSGTGVLPEGALHPDLVNRLTKEACNAARHVLRMCIRALDYCPAVDITFGEYLRALITADIDALPDDQYRYRLAFIEAFRKQGMLPPDVRTVSEETLSWNTLEDRKPEWLKPLLKNVDLAWDRDLDRSQIFAFNEKNRWGAWEALKKAFQKDPKLLAQFGLLSDVPRFDNEGNVISTPAKGETTFEVFGIRRARRVTPDGLFQTDVIATIHQRQRMPIDETNPDAGWFWFRGGATLILEARKEHQEVRYSIIKNSGSKTRIERQRQTERGGFCSPLRGLYFGSNNDEPFALMHD